MIQYNFPVYALFMAGMILCSTSIYAFTTEPTKPPPLDEQQAMAVLFSNFDVAPSTCQETVSPETLTIGKFIQTTLGYLAQERITGGSSRVDVVRIKLDDEAKEGLMSLYPTAFSNALREKLVHINNGSVLYQYTVWWNYAAGENVWSRGIQFLFYEPDRSLIKASFRCLSTP